MMAIGKVVARHKEYINVFWLYPRYVGVYTKQQIESKFKIRKGIIYENI